MLDGLDDDEEEPYLGDTLEYSFLTELLLDGLDDDEEEPYWGESFEYSNSLFIEFLLDGLDDGLDEGLDDGFDDDDDDDDDWLYPFLNNSLFVGFGIYSLSLLLLASLTRLSDIGSLRIGDTGDITDTVVVGEFPWNKELVNDLNAFIVWLYGWI